MRLGCLPYLNVKPLVYSFEHGELPAGWELVYSPPSDLAGMLAAGDIAAAPVSSFATFTQPELRICPGICIAADGPVQSVLLLSKNKLPNIDTVALDTGSLSGANMLRIVLDEAYGLRPKYISLPPTPVSSMLENCDAALVIGNPAMQCSKDGLVVTDLALEWRRLTGLPAVFAVWAGKGITPELVSALHDARAKGIARLEEIAREESTKLGLPFELCHSYLADTMVYTLGEREQAGLDLFKETCARHGLLPSEPTEVSA